MPTQSYRTVVLFVSLIFLCFCWVRCDSPVATLDEQDQTVIGQLIETWGLSLPPDWDSSNTSFACNWTGISCEYVTNDGLIVSELNLQELEGTIPSTIGNFSAIQAISLTNSPKLTGSLPSSLFSLSSLETLRVSSNGINGVIPAQTGLGNALRILDLSSNFLIGSLPLWIIQSLCLSRLELNNNQLDGILPDAFSSSQKLNVIDLSSNYLTGSVPYTLQNVHTLSSVDLSLNFLRCFEDNSKDWGFLNFLSSLDYGAAVQSGSCPVLTNPRDQQVIITLLNSWNGSCLPSNWNAKVDDVCSKPFTGIICDQNFNVVQLSLLPGASSCSLGNFSASIFQMEYLRGLEIFTMGLSGSISALSTNLSFSSLEHLETVNLGGNSLDGPIPEFGSRLQSLQLGNNNLSGSLPYSIMNTSVVDLSHNQLSGTVPFSALNGKSGTTSLLLGSNRLEGSLGPEMYWISVVDLDQNQLTGTLPEFEAVAESQLASLSLRENHFSGSVPASFCNNSKLMAVRFDGNLDMAGLLPEQLLVDMPMLSVLTFTSTSLQCPNNSEWQEWSQQASASSCIVGGPETPLPSASIPTATITLSFTTTTPPPFTPPLSPSATPSNSHKMRRDILWAVVILVGLLLVTCTVVLAIKFAKHSLSKTKYESTFEESS